MFSKTEQSIPLSNYHSKIILLEKDLK